MMSHQVTSGGTDALQMLQAQQAFRARTARPEPQQLPEQFEAPVDEVLLSREVQQPQREISAANRQPDPRQEIYREVQDIAGRLGYVGLSESAIQRAMNLGESLLADYRV